MTTPKRPHAFHTTRWTCVCAAKSDSEEGQRALEILCDTYYEPVVAYLRMVLGNADVARDMSHAFFAEMLAGGRIAGAEQERGKFRSYLLGAVKHFVLRQREAAGRLKRGGGMEALTLDADEELQVEDAQQSAPDAEFDRQWAMTVIARSLAALREQCVAEGRGAFFDAVSPLLNGNASHGEQTVIAEACGMSFDALRMAVTRLKRRLRDCVKAEVQSTLTEPAGVQEEMRSLFAALSR